MRFVFTWIVCHVLQMVDKRPFSFENDLFLFQNSFIISYFAIMSTPKILEKYFIFPIDNQRKSDIITRGLIL